RARIAQSSALPTVADEPASPVRDDSQGEACPTDSGFIADQDRATIAKSSTLPHDSAPRVTSPAADEGNEPASPLRDVSLGEACPTDSGFIANQDRATIARSSTFPYDSAPRVTSPTAEEGKDGKGMVAEGSGDDAPIKGMRLDEEEVATKRVSSDTEEIRPDEWEVAAEKVSDDTEELATVMITMDAASVLLSGGVHVVPTAAAVAPANISISTGSGVVPTASTTISTATPIFATATTV
nr:hypothetical protein [Tanacetum cinerariifolium]